MYGGDEFHRVKAAQEQPEGVRLVVVPVPDRDVVGPANVEQSRDNADIAQAAIRKFDQIGVQLGRSLTD